MSGLRHKARIITLQVLYELDCSEHNASEVLSRLTIEQKLPNEIADFVRHLTLGVETNKKVIDETISKYAPAFPVKQISAVDRNILRIAIFEMLFDSEVPFKAAINEAIEISKHFSSDTSPKFINGVLGSVAKHMTDHVSTGSTAQVDHP
ncbi:MAG TPA: transcription antitermination factor NusB [Dehalococcoidia bacterium]|nr:transcription antitermination factor NusB [Dehalococcoidia bacterium]